MDSKLEPELNKIRVAEGMQTRSDVKWLHLRPLSPRIFFTFWDLSLGQAVGDKQDQQSKDSKH